MPCLCNVTLADSRPEDPSGLTELVSLQRCNSADSDVAIFLFLENVCPIGILKQKIG